MSLLKANKPISAPDIRLNRTAPARYNGSTVRRILSAVFDPSANSLLRPAAAYGLGVYVPTKAIITKVWVDVITTFASASADAGTIALHVQSANDVVAAIAISDASNVWDAGIHGSKIGVIAISGDAETALVATAANAANMLKMTAEREITVTVGGQALTAGKMVVFVEYVLSE